MNIRNVCPICDVFNDFSTYKIINKENYEYKIVQCNNCRFIYVLNPKISVYNDNYNTFEIKSMKNIIKMKRRYFHIKKIILKFFAKHKVSGKLNVLEIGSGFGNLGRLIYKKENINYIGFEPNTFRANICREFGLNVKNSYFKKEFTKSNIDVVIFDNVLEHVFHPKELIKEALSVLIKNGLIIIIVPNFNDIRKYYPSWRRRHFYQPNVHINYFSLKDLKFIFKKFKIIYKFFSPDLLNYNNINDLYFLPRYILDKFGLCVFGLNIYGIKED